MILIADSGSTKTDWRLIVSQTEARGYKTNGMNPYFVNEESITTELEKELVPFISNDKVKAVFFYGAGCSASEKKAIVEDGLKPVFKHADIYINSDLLGAARSLCNNEKGIACILGTGSNSCVYDGNNIIETIPSLGYILGDEGSGADIGKRLLKSLLANSKPTEITETFFNTYQTSRQEILNKIYKHPHPNRYLASFALFAHKNISDDFFNSIVKKSFDDFFKNQLMNYENYQILPVSFTGSIAWGFQEILKQCAESYSIEINKIIQSPIDDLVKYHIAKDWEKYFFSINFEHP